MLLFQYGVVYFVPYFQTRWFNTKLLLEMPIFILPVTDIKRLLFKRLYRILNMDIYRMNLYVLVLYKGKNKRALQKVKQML